MVGLPIESQTGVALPESDTDSNALGPMIGVPQLRGNKDAFARIQQKRSTQQRAGSPQRDVQTLARLPLHCCQKLFHRLDYPDS